jgi:hypothetical protein
VLAPSCSWFCGSGDPNALSCDDDPPRLKELVSLCLVLSVKGGVTGHIDDPADDILRQLPGVVAVPHHPRKILAFATPRTSSPLTCGMKRGSRFLSRMSKRSTLGTC